VLAISHATAYVHLRSSGVHYLVKAKVKANMADMNVFFSSVALSELQELGLGRTTAFAHVLRNLSNYKVERERAFRCTFENEGQVTCKLRVSEIVPDVGSQVLYVTTNDRLLVLSITAPERSKIYDLKAIADSLQVLSATNWFETGLRLNVSALRDEMLAKLLVAFEQRGASRKRQSSWSHDLEVSSGYVGSRLSDPFLAHDSAELIQRLVAGGLSRLERRAVDNPVLVNRIKRLDDRTKQLNDRIKQLSDRMTNFSDTLVRSARRWLSKNARDNFKGLMEAAASQPQVVERDNDEIIVVSKRLLQRYADPKSAQSIVQTFFNRQPSLVPFEFDEPSNDAFDQFDLPKLQ
jgi:hypothetical protein